MAGPVIVVDASVAVKWVLPEPGSDDADTLLTGGEPLVAPSILFVEVTAAIAKRTHVGLLNGPDARTTLATFRTLAEDAGLRVFGNAPLLDSALALSAALRHPLADCLYVALAQARGGVLVTADRKLAEVAERAGLDGRVRRLPVGGA